MAKTLYSGWFLARSMWVYLKQKHYIQFGIIIYWIGRCFSICPVKASETALIFYLFLSQYHSCNKRAILAGVGVIFFITVHVQLKWGHIISTTISS